MLSNDLMDNIKIKINHEKKKILFLTFSKSNVPLSGMSGN